MRVPKEISALQARNLEYLMKGDLHVHSSASYDVIPSKKVSPSAVIQKQTDLGLIPVLTDHDTLDGINQLMESGKSVIPGVEIKIKPVIAGHTIHINIYQLNQIQFEDAEKIAATGDLDCLIDYLSAEELPFQYNHPFWHEPDEKLNICAVPVLAKKFPVIELNAARIKKLNDMAYNMAVCLGKGVTSSTDSHVGLHGSAFTLAQGADFSEFWDNIKNRNSYFVRHDLTIGRIFREVDERLKHLFDLDLDVLSKKKFHLETGFKVFDNFLLNLNNSNINSNKGILRAASYAIGYPVGFPAAVAIMIAPQLRTFYYAPENIKYGLKEVV